ncbi:hypothetical protein GCM10027299_30120 [Larkinella ripae]
MKNSLLIFLIFLGGRIATAQPQSAPQNRLLAWREAVKHVTLLNNSSGLIPVKNLPAARIASVHCGFGHRAVFDSLAAKYAPITGFSIAPASADSIWLALRDHLKLYTLVLITVSDSFALSPHLFSFITQLQATHPVVVVLSGTGKNLARFDAVPAPLIWYPTNTAEGASAAAQLVFGGMAATHRLETAFSPVYQKGSGYATVKTRLGYSLPEAVSIASPRLTAIDSLVQVAIAQHVTPGAVVLLAKDGQVVFHKAYGHHTYSEPERTKPDDIFDLASITKVSATTPAIMRLLDQNRLRLTDPISTYVAQTRRIPDKATITIREALLHEAGYTPYIKFYEQLRPLDLSADSSAAFPTPVADRYFLRARYFEEVMWPVTLRSPVTTRGKYVYSDVSMYMLKEVVETVSHQKLNEFVLNEFYRPLGMQATGFLPRTRFSRSRIAPTTDNDNWFRNMRVQGYVNDPGAAMAGGVEGHAGLFGNANDLAILYQLYLNKGTYGGQMFFKPATVDLFTARQSEGSGRGYGFDRTRLSGEVTKAYASDQAYGHSGYTGTYVWVDPKYNLVYICLTNRVYPDDSKTYGKPVMNLRALLLNHFYEAVVRGNE